MKNPVTTILFLLYGIELFSQVPKINLNFEHSAVVNQVTFNKNGKLAASASDDNTIKLWDVSSGREIRTFKGHLLKVNAVVFGVDNMLYSGSLDKTIRKWDLNTGKEFAQMVGHTDKVTVLAYSSVLNTLVSGSSDKTIRLWSTLTDNCIATLPPFHTKDISALAISPDGKILVSADNDGYIAYWNLQTKKLINSYKGHDKFIKALCVSPDGKFLASSGSTGTGGKFSPDKSEIKIWKFKNEKPVNIIGGHKHIISSIKYSPSGKTIIAVYWSGYITEWDAVTGNRINEQQFDIGSYTNVDISPSGDIIAIATTKNKIEFRNALTLEPIFPVQGAAEEMKVLALSQGSKLLATGGKRFINTWDLNTGKIVKSFSINENDGIPYISALLFTQSGQLFFASKMLFESLSPNWDKYFVQCDIKSGNKIKTFKGAAAGINTLAETPDQKYILSGGKGNDALILWDKEHGSIVKRFTGCSDYVSSLAFSPDGTKVLAGSGDNIIMLWDIKSGQILKKFIGHSSVHAFFKDGKSFISSGNDYSLKLWDIQTESVVRTFEGHNHLIVSAVLSPDEKTMASSSWDNTIKVWDINTGKNIATLTEHNDDVNEIKFIENGRILASASNDGTVKLWDTKTFKEIVTMISVPSGEWVMITPDGYWDASPNGGELVSMVRDTELWGIDQFAIRNNRPDIILERIGSTDKNLIAHYAYLYKKRLKKLDLTDQQFIYSYQIPTAKVLEIRQEGKNAVIKLNFNDNAYELNCYYVFVNDVPIFGIKGKSITGKDLIIDQPIELTKGVNKIEVSCLNKNGAESFRTLNYLTYNESPKQNLYLLAFGVSKYQNPAYNLAYADKDAIDLSKVIETYKGKGFENVYTKVLINEQVTPDAIKASKDFVKNAKPDDTFILFIAGHGMHDKDAEATYYYLTSNADVNNLKATAADFETIEDLLQGIPPRNKLFLMDACESGEIDDEDQGQMLAAATGAGMASRGFKTVTSDKGQVTSGKRTYLYQKDRYIYNDLVRRSGAIVFSSSKGGELSYERSDIENGLFTEYIMKALTTTEADKDNNGTVSTDELRQYVSEQVAKASGDLQHPTVDRDNIYQKFGFGLK